MQTVHQRFPHLDHLLNAYMHQDWQIYGETLEDVVAAYAEDTSSDDIALLHAEIGEFLSNQNNLTEPAYCQLYPNSALPSGWGMSVRSWLSLVDDLATQRAPSFGL